MNPNSQWQVIWNLLLQASVSEERKIALLMQYGVNLQNAEGDTFLIFACKQQNLPLAKLLLKCKADVDKVNNDNETPLFIAAHYNFGLVRLLVENGANINYVKESNRGDDYSIMGAAAVNGSLQMISYLFERGANINLIARESFTPLFLAVQEQNLNAVNFLLSCNADPNIPNQKGQSPLYIAVEFDDPKIAIALLKYHANANQVANNKNTPLMHAVEHRAKNRTLTANDKDLLSCLVQHGAEVNQQCYDGAVPLQAACFFGNVALVKYLIFLKANPNQTIIMNTDTGYIQTTMLDFAARLGNFELIKVLLAQKPEINKKNSEGGTALHSAAVSGNERMVRLLLNAGADPNIKDNTETTPLYLACQEAKFTVVVALLEHPTNKSINIPRIDGTTPLHISCQKNSLDIVVELCKNGAKINPQHNQGATPLLIAAQEGFSDIVHHLLLNGADATIARSDGNVPLINTYLYAPKKDKEKITEMILNYDPRTKSFKKEKYGLIEIKYSGDRFGLLFFQNIKSSSDTETITYQETSSTESAFSYLQKQGYSKNEIFELRQKIEINDSKISPVIILKKHYTWFNNSLNTEMMEVTPIERDNSTPHYYLYIDEKALEQQNIQHLSLFKNLRPKFCAVSGEPGIKRINKINLSVDINGSVQEVEIMYELKIKQHPCRILCFSQVSDDDNAVLLIAFYYLKNGIHTKRDSFFASNPHFKPVKLHIPIPESTICQAVSKLRSFDESPQDCYSILAPQ